LNGGHYVATCKNFTNGKWYKHNDSWVSETTAASAVTGQAYVLFYKRRTGALKWAGIEPLSEADKIVDPDE
jgi:Ubiquitin carboxyl-terminal hydrolase